MGTLRLTASAGPALLAMSTACHALDLTYVSTFGTDTGACERGTPCRTLNFALGQTDTGGAIIMLDAGEYSPVTVDKSVTIQGQGRGTRINNASATGVVVSGTSTIFVLRDLSIGRDGGGSTQTGVHINSGISINLENIAIENLVVDNNSFGLLFAPLQNSALRLTNVNFNNIGMPGQAVATAMSVATAPSGVNYKVAITGSSFDRVGYAIRVFAGAGTLQFSMDDTTISNTAGNGLTMSYFGGGSTKVSISRATIANSGGHGMEIGPSGGTHRLTIKDSEIVNNGGNGLMIAPTGSAKVNTTVMGSAFDGNVIGIRSFPANPAKSSVSISDTSASNNVGGVHASGNSTVGIIRGNVSGNSSYGVGAASPATVRIGSSMVNGNALGLSGPISSYGNNQLLGNTTQGSSTPVAPGSVP